MEANHLLPTLSFANNCRGKALDIYIKSPAYSTDKYKEVPYLDVSSTYEPSRNEVVINVVNRNKDKAITADILSQTGSFDKKRQPILYQEQIQILQTL